MYSFEGVCRLIASHRSDVFSSAVIFHRFSKRLSRVLHIMAFFGIFLYLNFPPKPSINTFQMFFFCKAQIEIVQKPTSCRPTCPRSGESFSIGPCEIQSITFISHSKMLLHPSGQGSWTAALSALLNTLLILRRKSNIKQPWILRSLWARIKETSGKYKICCSALNYGWKLCVGNLDWPVHLNTKSMQVWRRKKKRMWW